MVDRYETKKRMSGAVVHNGTVYLSGQVAEDRTADFTTQTKQTLARIDKLLAAAGTDKTKLVSASIWLTDMRYFDEMNAVWDAWVAEGCSPARATVGAPLATTGFMIEIAVIAAV